MVLRGFGKQFRPRTQRCQQQFLKSKGTEIQMRYRVVRGKHWKRYSKGMGISKQDYERFVS